MRPALLATALAIAGLAVGACATQGIDLSSEDPNHEGAMLFAERCSGCHTFEVAGAEGSGDQTLRMQGPNLDQRVINYEDALFAIQHGGFSGAIMPQNIVVGEEAEAVARLIAEHSGGESAEGDPEATEALEGPGN